MGDDDTQPAGVTPKGNNNYNYNDNEVNDNDNDNDNSSWKEDKYGLKRGDTGVSVSTKGAGVRGQGKAPAPVVPVMFKQILCLSTATLLLIALAWTYSGHLGRLWPLRTGVSAHYGGIPDSESYVVSPGSRKAGGRSPYDSDYNEYSDYKFDVKYSPVGEEDTYVDPAEYVGGSRGSNVTPRKPGAPHGRPNGFQPEYIVGRNNVSVEARQVLLSRFAPRIQLHPRDRWRPADPRVIFNVSTIVDRDVPMYEALVVPDEYLHGNPVNMTTAKVDAPASAQVVQEGPGRRTYIQYWLYYPINGCQGFRVGLWTGLDTFIDQRTQNFEWCGMAFHKGDWEHITLKLNRRWDGTMDDIFGNGTSTSEGPLEVEWVAFSQHAGAQWVRSTRLQFVENTHVVVYAGMNSHANYPVSGVHKNLDDTFDFVSRITPILSFGSVQWIQIVDVADIMGDLFLYDEPVDGNAQRYISWDTWNLPVLDITDRVVINDEDPDNSKSSNSKSSKKSNNNKEQDTETELYPYMNGLSDPQPPKFAGAEDWALFDGSWGEEYDQTLIVEPPAGVQAGAQLHATTKIAAKLGILKKFVRKHEKGPKGPRSHRVFYTLDYPPLF